MPPPVLVQFKMWGSMIDMKCSCATPRQVPESSVGRRLRCPDCGLVVQTVSGEEIAEGSGEGDFDAGLIITAGPEAVGTQILLGGAADLCIGKLPERHFVLPGKLVSRLHCKLSRTDFRPSQWKVTDNHSTNGLFVNRQRVAEHELRDGDVIGIGEYQLEFRHFESLPSAEEDYELEPLPAPVPAVAAIASRPAVLTSVAGAGPICPSCEAAAPTGAKICVACGINISSGRPVLTSHGIDENSLYESARQWIRVVSLLVWVTPMPIPIRSEAYGTRKPYVIWTIAAITILTSIAFFIAQNTGGEGPARPGSNFMLWSPSAHRQLVELSPQKIHSIAQRMTPKDRETLREQYADSDQSISDDELVSRAAAAVAVQFSNQAEFHWYQLITHAFLHDTSSISNFAMHLAGNMLFMLVFGARVNALIGNIATALLYPLLAVCAATAQLLSIGDGPSGPMLGASGAIMGLAGMYLILFPAHRVFCAMWISIWLSFRRIFGCKIFQLRGFWILLIYFAYDIVSTQIGFSGGVAHWAHIGGFVTGMLVALGILFSRMFNTRGSDVLSVTLGKYAWPLIGKPSRWNVSTVALPRPTSLNYA